MRVHTFAAAELGSGEGRPSPDELEQRGGRVDLAAGHLVAPPVEREHHLLQLHVGRSISPSLATAVRSAQALFKVVGWIGGLIIDERKHGRKRYIVMESY